MKKKIYSGVAVLAVAAMAAWNVSLSSKSSDMSDVSLANVEVLAQSESGLPCHTDFTYNSCTPFNYSYYCPCASGPLW